MNYKNSASYSHGDPAKVGVLITNLGTPQAPTAKALRPYLSEFLSDPRVVEFPRLLWKIILHGIILRIRPRRSAKAYATVWQEEGSPLAIYTQQQCAALKTALHDRFNDNLSVHWAMRYGQPAIADTLQTMIDEGVQKLLVLPLYPQYSASTNGSTFDAIAADFTHRRWLPDLRFVASYYEDEGYLNAVVKSIQAHWQAHGRQDKLIFSYHGIPLRYLHNGDPYHCMCHKTTRLIAEKLNLQPEEYMTCFQSRFGREAWLQPYTDKTLQSLAAAGTKSIAVICPGFSSDCLETIEEIGEENRDYFLEAGGETFHYIPALNASPEHIDALVSICAQNLQGWDLSEKAHDHACAERYTAHVDNKKQGK